MRAHFELLQGGVPVGIREGGVQDLRAFCRREYSWDDDPYPLKGGGGREYRVVRGYPPGQGSSITPKDERFDTSGEWGQLGKP